MKKYSWQTAPDEISEKDICREYNADIVVIGAGSAGTSVARSAAENGASVIVLEKRKKNGFSATGRDFGHINSNFLKEHGVPEVDPIEFFNDWQLKSGNRSNPKFVMQYAKTSGSCFDWFIEPLSAEQRASIQVKYWPARKPNSIEIAGQKFWYGTASFPNTFRYDEAVRINHSYMETLDIVFFFEYTAIQLRKRVNTVDAVYAKDKVGNVFRFSANKGVVLAAGDFSANDEMMTDLCDEIQSLLFEGRKVRSMSINDGSGIKLGIWAGGIMAPGPIATMGGTYFYPQGPIADALTLPTLWLDRNGKRYCNEAFGDMVFSGVESIRQPAGALTVIFDSAIFDNMKFFPPYHTAPWKENKTEMRELRKVMDAAVQNGKGGAEIPRTKYKLYAADTYRELAEMLSDSIKFRNNFCNSVNRYNNICRNQRDEDFGKNASLLFELRCPPYFAFQGNPDGDIYVMATVDGLWTDDFQNVIDIKRNPIPGLYACGNCCGRRWGVQYHTPVSGANIGMAWTLGRILGTHLAKSPTINQNKGRY